MRYGAIFQNEKCYCDKSVFRFPADLCVKETVSRCPAAGRAVRYTNCTVITNFTSLVSGSIGEMGKNEKLLGWSRARNRNKEKFRFSTEQTGERGDVKHEIVSEVKFVMYNKL
jgi:hypothetical protein